MWHIINTYAKWRCPTLCENVEYHVRTATSGKNYMEYENTTTLWVGYAEPKIRIEEEYTLMGVNSIISATGGSLGLFLGLSCYGVAWNILDMVENDYYSITSLWRRKKTNDDGDHEDNPIIMNLNQQ